MSAAAHTALGTAELLEAVLYALPTKDLLLAQRVCRPWCDAIAGSKKIQEALFLVPIGIVEAFCGPPIEDYDNVPSDFDYEDETWHKKDFDELIKGLLGNTIAIDSDGYFNVPFFYNLPMTSSCLKMFISQPAVTSCSFEMLGNFRGNVCRIRDVVESEQGVTVRDLVKHVTTEWPRRAGVIHEYVKASYRPSDDWMEEFQSMAAAEVQGIVKGRHIETDQQAITPHVMVTGCKAGNAAWSWLTDNMQLDQMKEGIKNDDRVREAAGEVSGLKASDRSEIGNRKAALTLVLYLPDGYLPKADPPPYVPLSTQYLP